MTHTHRYLFLALCAGAAASTPNVGHADGPIMLHQSDFENGTYQIVSPGTYRLAEDISFNPHPAGSLADDGQTVLDAYHAGKPFPSQYGATADGKYDPAAFGIGFFAAITISAPDVVLDLNGFTIEQSPEHALLQRFFAVIETADQPFVPAQGPSNFGAELVTATNLKIRNGTIGRSSHHGIHGNGNRGVRIENVDFIDFEVGAVALNGVSDLKIINSTASNREDVPVIGTFSNARFISDYVDFLVATGSPTTLTVQGVPMHAADVQGALRSAINAVHEDVIVDGLGAIDSSQHPAEYALFHNKYGVVDGNSYGYLVNPMGVAVQGFPKRPSAPALGIELQNVRILRQQAFVNEVVALKQGAGPAIDPVGAVFMVRNVHPTTGMPNTISSLDDASAVYTGNVLANAQALVAKAALAGEFPPFLDVSRLNIKQAILDWIEGGTTLATLVSGPSGYLCNGDTMFHVNKGVIGFKLDGAKDVTIKNTSAERLENFGGVGSAVCGDYTFSHPQATLPGYGGARVRGYSIAGSEGVTIESSRAEQLRASSGSVIGFDVLTDSREISLRQCSVQGADAGAMFVSNGGPSELPDAFGLHIAPDAQEVETKKFSASGLVAFDEVAAVRDESTPEQAASENE